MTSLESYYNTFLWVSRLESDGKYPENCTDFAGVPRDVVDHKNVVLGLVSCLIADGLVTPNLAGIVTSEKGVTALQPKKELWGMVYPRVVSQNTFDAAAAAAEELNVANNPCGDEVMAFIYSKSEIGDRSGSLQTCKQFLGLRVKH